MWQTKNMTKKIVRKKWPQILTKYFLWQNLNYFFESKGRHPKKSRLLLDIVHKGGGWFNPNPKVLGYFFVAFFWTFKKRGGGWTHSKSFGVVFFGLSFGHFQKRVGLSALCIQLGARDDIPITNICLTSFCVNSSTVAVSVWLLTYVKRSQGAAPKPKTKDSTLVSGWRMC